MNQLKIALLSTPFFGVPPLKYGGSEMVLWDLANGLIKLGHKVVIFAPKGSQIPKGGFIFETNEPLNNVQVDWLKAEEDMFDKYVGNHLDGFDILHGHNWFGMEYKVKSINPKIAVCHSHHGHINPEWWCKTKPPFKLNFITISKFMQNEAKQQGIESQYVYNGIDLDKYLYQEKKGDRLLFVGRIDTFKRPHIAIEVAKKLGLGLDIVGSSFVKDPNYPNQIKQQCDGNQIKLHLDASQEDKVKFYQNAKCVIFPSKMDEPFGLITPEANSCGTAVIGSRDGAIPETIENGVNGFICDTINEMCYAVERINEIKPENCRKRVEQYFSRDIMAQNYERLYKEILEGKEW